MMLVFLFLITPLAPVFAEADSAPNVSSSDTPVAADASAVSAAEPAAAIPADAQATAGETDSAKVKDDKTADTDTINGKDDKVGKEGKGDPTTTATASSSTASEGGGANTVSQSTAKQLLPQTDEATGALVYDYPIVVPPGRNGMQPDLKLKYNNQSVEEGSIFGAGWTLDIPYIERISRKGTDKLYSENFFNSSLSGELLLVSGNQWGAKVDDGSFLKYTFDGSSWTVKDKSGVTYKFGNSATTRQDNPDYVAQVYKWMLEEVRDMNGNYIRYEYFKDNGQIYPSRIIYTGNGSTDGAFEVTLLRETRQDKAALQRAGFSVISNYRVKEIDIKTNSVLTRKYVLSYVNGENSLRSLLDSVTESGIDDAGVMTTLPLTDFNYESQPNGWTVDTSFNVDSSIFDAQKRASHLLDVNGDGLLDVLNNGYIFNSFGGFGIESVVYLNNGHGWTKNASWTVDPSQLDLQNSATRFVDVNGDGLVDILNSGKVYNDVNYGSYVLENAVYLNNGHGWTKDSSWVVDPSLFDTKYNNTRILDINGDGLPDILNKGSICYYSKRADRCDQQITRYAVYINNGHGWTDGLWNVDSSIFQTIDSKYALHTIDVNGDGLPDIINTGRTRYAEDGYKTLVFINNGHGWTKDSSWNTNPALFDQRNLATHLMDVNGDSLADIVNSGRVIYYDQNMVFHDTYETAVYLNTGNGWEKDTSWNFDYSMFDAGVSSTNIGDYDGDGLTDVISYGSYTYYGADRLIHDIVNYAAYKNIGSKPDSLKTIYNNKGGSTSISYKAASRYEKNGIFSNSNVPFPLETVNTITNDNGLGTSFGRQFEYEGGKFYYNNPFERKFSGFAKVTMNDDAGNKTINYYHQGDATNSAQGEYDDHIAKAGRIYRTETTDAAGNVYSKSISKWDKSDLGNGRNFVKQTQQIDMTYDGNSTHKDSAETYDYDNTTGNLIQRVQKGEVSASDNGTYSEVADYDNMVTTYVYASNVGYNILGLPSDVIMVDASGDKIKEDRYFYDWQDLGSATQGNETRHERWVAGEDYVGTQKAYDDFGTPTITTDARGVDTFYNYDDFHLYPAVVTNTLDQATSYLYDYSSGQVKQMTDVNGRVFQNVYDGLDRLIAEKQPDLTTPTTLVSKSEYVYTDTPGAISVQKKDYLSASAIVNSITYFDGLGRKIQERKQAEGTNYEVADYVYNNLDLLQKKSLPYFSVGIAKTAATATAALYTNYTYDPMYRVVTQVDAAGTISNLYDDWKLKVTDRNGKAKDLYKDGYGRLVRVDEYLAGVAYSTYYEYDGADNLTKITDAAGNVRYFTYNGLGLRWSAEDLHSPDDDTYGIWYFDYDENGNLVARTDPNDQTVRYEYDELSRLLAEYHDGEEGAQTIYEYDSGANGVGRLRLVIGRDYEQINNYNSLGGIASEIKTIGGEDYTTSYTYDRQGNVLTLINPDNSAIKYVYGVGGLLNTVSRKESSSTAYSNVITNFDYSPTEQLTITAYANGMKTTNAYNAAKLYRLSSKTTTIAGAVKGQSIAYTYDNNGNITKLIDSSATDSKKTVVYTYDDLNRLLSATATGVAIGQSNYTERYVYDIIGNIVSKTGQGNYEYNGNEGDSYANPHAVTNIDGMEFTYDNNGNLLSKGDELINTWNYDNRLVSDIAGDITSTYTYDVSGQRLTSSDGGATTIYANKYYNANDGNATKHIFANGLEVAVVTGSNSGAVIHYTATDHLTGSSLTTNSSDAKEELLDYLPFGTIRIDQKAGSYSDQRKFAGMEYDNDTGLSYANARYYDSNTGRFISQDPAFLAVGDKKKFEEKYERTQEMHLMDPQSLNSYSYVNNNPLRYTDPEGEVAPVVVIVAGWAITEAALFVNDVYNAGKTVMNSNASWTDKGIAVAGAGVGLIAPGGGYGKISNYTSRFGVQLGTKMDKIYNSLKGSGYIFSDHAIQRIAERIGVGKEKIVLNVLRNNKPFEYFHEGTTKLGYYDAKAKIFIGQIKGSKNVATIITNASAKYVENLKK